VEDLRIAIGRRPGAEVVPVRAVHNHLLGMARAPHERGHVVADDGPHLVVQGQTRAELQGNGFEATPRRRTRELIEAESSGGKELPGGLVAQPALGQRMVGITRRQLLPRSGIAVLHHLPGITRGPGLMHDEHTGCALARGLRTHPWTKSGWWRGYWPRRSARPRMAVPPRRTITRSRTTSGS